MSDMGSNFQSLANHLQVTPAKPWFKYNNRKYFLMFDPPHLLKSVRKQPDEVCAQVWQTNCYIEGNKLKMSMKK